MTPSTRQERIGSEFTASWKIQQHISSCQTLIMDELFALMSFLSHMHFQNQIFKHFIWMSHITLEDKTIPRDAAHTVMQTEFLPCQWMRRTIKIWPFSFSTAVVSVQKAAIHMVTSGVAPFLSGLHPQSLLCCAA